MVISFYWSLLPFTQNFKRSLFFFAVFTIFSIFNSNFSLFFSRSINSNISYLVPPLYLNALNLAICSAPCLLHPKGLLDILSDKTWLTCPSALQPNAYGSSLYIFIPAQFSKIYFLASFIAFSWFLLGC